MITGELKTKVDRIWDTMWSGGISNPLSVIEQLSSGRSPVTIAAAQVVLI